MFPELTPWVAGPRVAGKRQPWPPSVPGKGAENEWSWPQGGGGAGSPCPGCAGLCEACLAEARAL